MIEMRCKASCNFIHSITYLSPQIETRKRKSLIHSTQTFMHASIHPSIPRCARARANSSTQFSHQGIRPLTQSKAKQIKGEKQAHIYHFVLVCCVLASQYVRERRIGGKAVVK
jgi:DNA topoisomerase IA